MSLKNYLEQLLSRIGDKQLLYITLALISFGFYVQVTAASGSFLFKQFIYFAIASAAVIWIHRHIELQFYKNYSSIIYWFNIILLIILKLFGSTVLGAQRWLKLGPISLQPSELTKICLIIILATWLSSHPVRDYFDIFKTAAIVALPAILVLLQPDLGTTLVYIAISLGMLYWAGASVVQLLVLISPLITAICASLGYKIFDYEHPWFSMSLTVPALLFMLILIASVTYYYQVWREPLRMTGLFVLIATNIASIILRPSLWGLLKEYQQQRLTIFLNPDSDPLGAGYHIIQSLYAIGSGGLFGKGLMAGDLTQGHFVPEQHTDFAFSAIGEELGFLGAILVVILYALLCQRIIKAATLSNNKFNSLLAIGIFSMLLFHIFVNIGMNLSLMPITGVPLPFLSYGGTSMLVNLFLVSVALKVSQANQLSARSK